MTNISIRAKILGLIGLLVIGLGTFIGIGYVTTPEELNESDYQALVETKDLIADVLPPPLYAVEALGVAYAAAYEAQPVPMQIKARWKQLEDAHANRHAHWTRSLPEGGLRTALVDRADRPARRMYQLGRDVLFPALAVGDSAQVKAALTAMRDSYDQHRAQVDEVVRLANQQGEDDARTAAAHITQRKLKLTLLGILIAVAATAIGLYISRDVSRRLQHTSDLLEAVAAGDFSRRTEVGSNDEIGLMSASLDRMLDEVERALLEVQGVAETVANASRNLSAQSDQLSAGAHQQASSLEETAATLEQITAAVKQSSDNAQQASRLATGSRETAQSGGEVVGKAVGAMNEITAASRRIGDIITAIDEIALQTNLLALNAAVEAARAGEQGRGFAVVAGEVSSLAQRSAAAAKEVKSLIGDTLSRVETGHKLVGQSGQTLDEIITSVAKVTDIVGEIASGAREQASGIEQVNQAVTQMDRVTQENAGQTEQLARTAVELSSSAEDLRTLVQRFQLRSTTEKPTKDRRHDFKSVPARPAVA